jgi:hypothetical protein
MVNKSTAIPILQAPSYHIKLAERVDGLDIITTIFLPDTRALRTRGTN